jgi:predicted nucleotidyltransferase
MVTSFMSTVPVKTIEEIRQRSAAILRKPEYEPIEWVGLYGSFCRSTQTAESDVDLVVGYRAGTPMMDVYTVASGLGDELSLISTQLAQIPLEIACSHAQNDCLVACCLGGNN